VLLRSRGTGVGSRRGAAGRGARSHSQGVFMFRKHGAPRALTVVTLGALVALLGVVPGAVAKAPRRAIRGAHPSWARKRASLGDATSRVTAKVYLQPNGGIDALRRDTVARSTKGSSLYHRWLTPAAFRAKYAPSA